jgi:hypothetical protein
MTQKVKLMADYGCYPLWWLDSDKIGDIDPANVPLSVETINRLEKWADTYDSKLNNEDPESSTFANEDEKNAFEKEGINLWKRLQTELGDTYEIVYFSEKLHKVVANESELKVFS